MWPISVLRISWVIVPCAMITGPCYLTRTYVRYYLGVVIVERVIACICHFRYLAGPYRTAGLIISHQFSELLRRVLTGRMMGYHKRFGGERSAVVYTATHIAECILNECGNLSTMKLQKLVYYSQAAHLVYEGKPLFSDRIEAWANGPVVPELFKKHRHKFIVTKGFLGDSTIDELDVAAARSICRVLDVLGNKTGAELSELTHSERPWSDARVGYAPAERCDVAIAPESIRSYYSASNCANPVFA